MFKTNHVAYSVLLAALSLVACSRDEGESASGSSAAAASKATRMEKTCKKTACEAKQDDDSVACSRCLAACSNAMEYGYCDPSVDCHYSCSASACSEDDSKECVEYGWHLHESFKKDPTVERDCLAQVNDLQTCTDKTFVDAEPFCAQYAKLVPPGDTSLNACLTKLACGENPTSCPSGDSTFGDDLCAQASSCDDACDDDLRKALNRIGGWARSEVLEAGKGCAKESCDDVGACLRGFVYAVGS